MDELDWNDLKIFLTIAQASSLRKAAQQLGCSQPTLGRHLASLESALNLTLVARHARGIKLTEDGQMLYQHARSIRETVQHLQQHSATRAQTLRGHVTISATDIVGVCVLTPMLADLRRAYPEIELRLLLDHRASDLHEGRAQMAVRMFQPQRASLVGRFLGSVPLGVYASDHEPVTHLAELKQAHWISAHDETFHKTFMQQHMNMSLESTTVSFRSDSFLAQIQACDAGMGVMVLQHHVAHHWPNLRLVLDLPEYNMPLWLVLNEQVKDTPHVRVVFDGLCDALSAFYERDWTSSLNTR